MSKRADEVQQAEETDYARQNAELGAAEQRYKLSAAEQELDKLGPLSSFMYNAH